ncbi:RagB/SusD family nutrient uptake outer membrane protein [Pedobacter sp. MC2016-24]|uniref:RagB/SusD family nutrient uptake outer membrane protein n=1 Tax=Pedobacter sp. MC2016-24 TaxID=2780090 RepID=UPI0018808953|nr:RagB/SusD family nutrient uptake outer membrane protein [Pedobacter sp. MC2016-24]MBE9597960.1 RagB/SusD family nutrient uptake outer membrane protein [Pedobacter sp. MC2016-24]
MKNLLITYKNIFILSLIGLVLLAGSCKKFVDVDAPNSQLVSETVFTNDNTVKSALAGLYSSFAISSAASLQFDLSIATGASADELSTTALEVYDPFLTHTILPNNVTTYGMWSRFYTVIYQANAIIEGINASSGGVTDAVKNQAIGESKFIRAFCYFYLVNLWGDVPLALTTDRVVNNTLTRTPKAVVYQQIISDLIDAKGLLVSDFSYGSGQRIRANSYAAIALLSRVYLYTNDWANAEANATVLINNNATYSLLSTANLSTVYVKNNTEAIFQLDAPQSGVSASGSTYEGLNYAVSNTTVPQYQLSTSLVNAFETGDRRFSNWVGISNYTGGPFYYFYKFKNKVANTTATGEYVTYLRLAEQYLIRAEARAQQSNFSNAISDINVIRNRANLGGTAAVGQTQILLAIEQERRIELFGEYGHRWNDLRRTGRATAVLGQKPNWTANSVLYPIPQIDRVNNKNLSQNAGY